VEKCIIVAKSASQLPQPGRYWCHSCSVSCGSFVAVAIVVAVLWQLIFS